MLSLLHIENIAVIESADIQFDKGFNALTGETGAGKSIVVDAIGAIIGERTSRDLIRTGARSALVNAVFTGLPPLAWFQENGGGPDEDGNLLIQREIQPDGKNVCRLNGRLITVAQLRQLGRQLLNGLLHVGVHTVKNGQKTPCKILLLVNGGQVVHHVVPPHPQTQGSNDRGEGTGGRQLEHEPQIPALVPDKKVPALRRRRAKDLPERR